MATRESSPKRMRADIVHAAKRVARAEHRTETEQINYWASLGMHLERSLSAPGRRVLAVVTGEAQFSTLDPDERRHAHAAIDAAISERIERSAFGDLALADGHPIVCLDDDGLLVEVAPDGSSRHL